MSTTVETLPDPNAAGTEARPPTAPRPRWATFDLARLVAAYGIVWVHAVRSPALETSKALGRFAVPFFVFAAVFFVIDGVLRRPWQGFGEYTRSRVHRIYIPFLAWSGIYLALKLAKAAALPELPNEMPGWSIFWAGSFYHLWFMPFILVVSLAAFAVGKISLAGNRGRVVVLAACFIAGLLLALAPSPTVGLLAGGRGQAVAAALPAACWAVCFALVYRGSLARRLKHPASLIVAAVVLVASTAWVWHAGPSKPAETLAGLGFMVLALGPNVGGWAARLSRLGPLAYGIYLSHLVFIKVFEGLLTKLDVAVRWQADVGVFVAATVLSTLLAWGLSRWRSTRWLAV